MQGLPFFYNIKTSNRKTMKKYIFFIVLLGLGTACSTKLDKGSQAPDFELVDVEGLNQRLSKQRGKVVMVHFWTDFCNACRAEFPKIQTYYETLQSDDFELLAINVGQPLSVSKDFQEEFGASFPMLADIEGKMKSIYQINAFPTNYFVDPEGNIIRKIVGWVSEKQVEIIINQHKNKRNG